MCLDLVEWNKCLRNLCVTSQTTWYNFELCFNTSYILDVCEASQLHTFCYSTFRFGNKVGQERIVKTKRRGGRPHPPTPPPTVRPWVGKNHIQHAMRIFIVHILHFLYKNAEIHKNILWKFFFKFSHFEAQIFPYAQCFAFFKTLPVLYPSTKPCRVFLTIRIKF